VSRARSGHRVLLVTHRARTISLELPEHGTLVIGRSRECDVFLDDQRVSRRHAALHVQPDKLLLQDLGSHNGTILVGASHELDLSQTLTNHAAELRLVAKKLVPLSLDALVQIGSAQLTIRDGAPPRGGPHGIPGFVVVDPAMQRVLELADRVARTNLTVLLLGESGSGKEMLARYVHLRSPRATRSMVSLNCGALPETLLESELFGHEKGAFTGATATKPGLFEAAHGGTLFLDEVGELPQALQVKLLRVLEDRQVLRLGALAPRAADVRFVAATNRDLERHVADGKFREDLYYRLNGIAMQLPALRERPADIIPLAEAFLESLDAPQPGARPALSESARDKLRAYHWPGNVRQLKNVIHRALVMCSGREIAPDDLELRDRDSRPSGPMTAASPEELRGQAEEAERSRIVEALEECGGNQTRAAQRLGITRRVLVRRLEKYDLPRPRRDPRQPDDE
jgi:DNA-binding NtrC family response regulator